MLGTVVKIGGTAAKTSGTRGTTADAAITARTSATAARIGVTVRRTGGIAAKTGATGAGKALVAPLAAAQPLLTTFAARAVSSGRLAVLYDLLSGTTLRSR